jgi:hypothetical protein
MSLANRCQVPNTNNLVTKNLSIACADSCTLAPGSIFGNQTDISLTTCSSFNHTGSVNHRSLLDGSNVNPTTGANPFIIKADKNSIVGGGNAGIQHIALVNSGRDAILLQGNSHGYIGDVTGTNPNNGGVGIRCTNMSTARINQGGPGVLTTVTGAVPGVNDVVVGGTPRHYGAGPTTGGLPFTETDTLCRIEM